MPFPVIPGCDLFLVVVGIFAGVGWGVLLCVCSWCPACALLRCSVCCGDGGLSCGAVSVYVRVGEACVCCGRALANSV